MEPLNGTLYVQGEVDISCEQSGGLVQRSSSASMTHLLVITADHLPKGHLVAETVGRLIGVQGLAAQVWHGQVGGVRQQSR